MLILCFKWHNKYSNRLSDHLNLAEKTLYLYVVNLYLNKDMDLQDSNRHVATGDKLTNKKCK